MSSSSDLIADRRFAWARGYAEDGDHAAAADLLAQVVERVPTWPAGWAALGEARERSGDIAGARVAWARAGELDPEGALGAEAHRARLDGRTPGTLPDAYVRALFDDYAPRFDRHLVDALHYRGPAVVADALERAAPGRRFVRALDLGCGTGLMGLALRGRAERIDGVDLSPAMAERARVTGAYAEVTAGPLEVALAAAPGASLDLVVAADVLVYLGDLAPVLGSVARALGAGGLLAFTVQSLVEFSGARPRHLARAREGESQDGVGRLPPSCSTAEGGFALGPDMRFSHTPAHVEAALRAGDLRPLLLEPVSTRQEKGVAVPGLVVVAEPR